MPKTHDLPPELAAFASLLDAQPAPAQAGNQVSEHPLGVVGCMSNISFGCITQVRVFRQNAMDARHFCVVEQRR